MFKELPLATNASSTKRGFMLDSFIGAKNVLKINNGSGLYICIKLNSLGLALSLQHSDSEKPNFSKWHAQRDDPLTAHTLLNIHTVTYLRNELTLLFQSHSFLIKYLINYLSVFLCLHDSIFTKCSPLLKIDPIILNVK